MINDETACTVKLKAADQSSDCCYVQMAKTQEGFLEASALPIGNGIETTLLGGALSSIGTWSDIDECYRLKIKNNLYSPILLNNYSISNLDIVRNYLKKNIQLFDILIQLPAFLRNEAIETSAMHLNYFCDEDEEMEFLLVVLHIDDQDDESITNIENCILDEFFYPRAATIKGRIILSVEG